MEANSNTVTVLPSSTATRHTAPANRTSRFSKTATSGVPQIGNLFSPRSFSDKIYTSVTLNNHIQCSAIETRFQYFIKKLPTAPRQRAPH